MAGTTSTPTVTGDGYPVLQQQVHPWARGFSAELVVYLVQLGSVVVAVSGDPVALEASATRWDAVSARAGRVTAGLTQASTQASTWSGAARDSFDETREELTRDLTEYGARAERTASILRSAANDLRQGRRLAIQVVESFLAYAESNRQQAVWMYASAPAAARGFYQKALVELFRAHDRNAQQVRATVGRALAQHTEELQALTPSGFDRLWSAFKALWGPDRPRGRTGPGTPEGSAAEVPALADEMASDRKKLLWGGGLWGLLTAGAYVYAPPAGVLMGFLGASDTIDNHVILQHKYEESLRQAEQDGRGPLPPNNLRSLYAGQAAGQVAGAYVDGLLIGLSGGRFAATAPAKVSTAVGLGGFGYGTATAVIDGKSALDVVGSGAWSSVQALAVGNLQNWASQATPLASLGAAALPTARGLLWTGSNVLTQDALTGDVDGWRAVTTGFGGAGMTPVGLWARNALTSGATYRAWGIAGSGGLGVSAVTNLSSNYLHGLWTPDSLWTPSAGTAVSGSR